MTTPACKLAGTKMKKDGVSIKSAKGKLNYLANLNPTFSEAQRQRCEKGIDQAYGI